MRSRKDGGAESGLVDYALHATALTCFDSLRQELGLLSCDDLSLVTHEPPKKNTFSPIATIKKASEWGKELLRDWDVDEGVAVKIFENESDARNTAHWMETILAARKGVTALKTNKETGPITIRKTDEGYELFMPQMFFEEIYDHETQMYKKASLGAFQSNSIFDIAKHYAHAGKELPPGGSIASQLLESAKEMQNSLEKGAKQEDAGNPARRVEYLDKLEATVLSGWRLDSLRATLEPLNATYSKTFAEPSQRNKAKYFISLMSQSITASRGKPLYPAADQMTETEVTANDAEGKPVTRYKLTVKKDVILPVLENENMLESTQKGMR